METKQEHYESMMQAIARYAPSADLEVIQRAYAYADEKHKNQLRKSGEPYIIHPLAVAEIVAEIGLDTDAIAAALLHDCLEDTDASFEEISRLFGETVANLVEGVTKLTRVQYSTMEEQQMENLRKMFMAMSKDIRVILIKISDRLHNTRTLQYQTPAKQISKSMETMEVYAPLAHRLGMQKIKWELEDTSLQYLDPEGYQEIIDYLKKNEDSANSFMNAIQSKITTRLASVGIHGSIYGRIKHTYSIYRKMRAQNKTIDELYDLYAFRVIVDNIADCYNVLGHIHDLFNPIPGRFKDYISTPKPNMYQSLHTTLIGPKGQPFEIQIRTYEMHRTAEFGIAAHWKYKESSDGKKPVGQSEEEKLNWLRQILEWQRDMSDNREFMSLLKNDLDLFADSVYCFTPQGDVKTLPSGSTPVDFAYSVHSAVGNKMVGARVNGKLVPIEYEIKNGDRIEIITSQNSQGPSRDWLKLVKSTQAKNKINQWFKKELKEDNILKGKEMLAQYARAKGFKIANYTKTQYLEAVLRKYGFRDWDSVLAAIGHGGLKEGQVFNKLVEAYDKENKKNLTDEQVLEAASETQEKLHIAKSKSGIVVKGIHDVAVRFSKCCNPIPGDEIVGFVTRGRGITIHRTDCVNVLNMSETDRTRLIEAEWQQPDTKEKEKYMAEIQVYANNRTGLLVDLSKIFTERKIDLRSINSRTSKQEKATISMSFEIGSKEELRSLIEKIRQVESVIDVERTTG